ncbi:MAG: neutral/alkaline non-lysosomal ceramidase N-terminal domain-containing protein [Kiritimatiellia bacterium]
MRAGTARVKITPPVGSPGSNGKRIREIRSDLYAKALVLDDGGKKAAIVTIDILLLGKCVVAEARALAQKQTGIPAENILLAASHTHSGGGCSPMRDVWGTAVYDPKRVDELVAKIAGVVAEADSRLVEAGVRVGRSHVDLNVNRWISTPDGAKWAPNPDGPADRALSVLRMDDAAGRPFCAIVNYAAHASVATWGEHISADFPGYMQAALEKLYGPDFQAQFMNGASGDLKVNWLVRTQEGKLDFGYGKDDGPAKRYGVALAGEAIKAFELSEPVGDCRLAVASGDARFPLLTPPSAAEVERILKEKRAKGENCAWEERILPQLRDNTAPSFIPGEVQMLRLGPDVAIAAVPGELFAAVGLAMRERLDCKNLFIAGYANGYAGYLPSDASCREDGDKPRYDWHKFFWYPAGFAEGSEKAVLETAAALFASTTRELKEERKTT